MTRWTQADVDRVKLRQGAKAKPSKYRAQPVMIDGIRFDSKKEGARYVELKLQEKAGLIAKLEVQPRFELWAHNLSRLLVRDATAILVAEYVADFRYRKRETPEHVVEVIEDVKSPITRTPLYKLKKKFAEACHGITITEV